MTISISPCSVIAFRFAIGVLLLTAYRGALAQEQEWMVKPTEEHKLLQKDVGTWDAVIKVWPGEGAQPMESQGTEKNELLPGGLWLVSRFEGKIGDMPFTGVGTFGYDPTEKKYIGTWVDTMSPYPLTTKGDYDAATKTSTAIGEGRDGMTGKMMKTKMTTRFIDDNDRVFEMYAMGEDGTTQKMMEISYKRRAE